MTLRTPRSSWKRRSRPTRRAPASRPARCAPMSMPPSSATISAPRCKCSGRSRRCRRAMPATGCGWRAPSYWSSLPMLASRPCCWSAPRPWPISPISAPAIAARRPRRWRCSAAPWRSGNCGGRRSTPCGCRSNCARPPMCAANMNGCATNTASGCSTTRWIRNRRRRGSVSSSRKTSPSAPILPRSWRWPAPTSRH